MLHANSLPDSTRRVLDRLSKRNDVEGFTLIGGTALALRHGHRISEDIDLAWTRGELPMDDIRRIIDELPIEGAAINLIDPLQRDLAENEGMYLAANQQDWKVDDVKVTFYAQPPRNAGIIESDRPERIGTIKIASDDALFKLKSVVLLDRTASRDLFDLWWFVRKQGRTIDQILANMREFDPHMMLDMHMQKLAPSRLPSSDPGFDTRLDGAPRNAHELLEVMKGLVEDHQREIAKRVAMQSALGIGARGL